ncbi:hypothetical protein V8G54_003635 [Vigna mungo]|uniref:Cupin type-1 domain-containing protein n=1 Tax=Vigna mungo TaxID=3915 RepID=A0AAQ3PAD5_VIGMU
MEVDLSPELAKKETLLLSNYLFSRIVLAFLSTLTLPRLHMFYKEVIGVDDCRVLETNVKAGNLFIVSRFFVLFKIADSDGLKWFSIVTTPNPVFIHLAVSIGAWKALSPSVLQAAFNVDEELEKLFRSKKNADAIFFPPPN